MPRLGRGARGGIGEGSPAPEAHAQPTLQCGAAGNPVPRIPRRPLSSDSVVFAFVGRGGPTGKRQRQLQQESPRFLLGEGFRAGLAGVQAQPQGP